MWSDVVSSLPGSSLVTGIPEALLPRMEPGLQDPRTTAKQSVGDVRSQAGAWERGTNPLIRPIGHLLPLEGGEGT